MICLRIPRCSSLACSGQHGNQGTHKQGTSCHVCQQGASWSSTSSSFKNVVNKKQQNFSARKRVEKVQFHACQYLNVDIRASSIEFSPANLVIFVVLIHTLEGIWVWSHWCCLHKRYQRGQRRRLAFLLWIPCYLLQCGIFSGLIMRHLF